MLIHMDGFDIYATGADLSYQYSSSMGVGTTSGRFGQGGVSASGGTGYYPTIQKSLNTNYTDIWTGFAIAVSDAGGYGIGANTPGVIGPGDQTVVTFGSNGGTAHGQSGTVEAFVTYNALLGTWRFCNGTQVVNLLPALIAVGTYNVGQGSWHWVDIHYVPSLTSGTVEIWVDGTQVISKTGVVTACWLNQVNTVYLGNPGLQTVNSSSGTVGGWFDDWYILDASTGPYNTTKIGDSRIFTMVPNRDAGPNNGVPNIGTNHYAMVDESQNDKLVTFLTIQGLARQEELFGMTPLPTTPSTVWATRVVNVVEQTAGGIISANAIVISNGVEAQSISQPLLSVFFNQFGIFETDPSTNVPWTYSNVNIAEVGFVVA